MLWIIIAVIIFAFLVSLAVSTNEPVIIGFGLVIGFFVALIGNICGLEIPEHDYRTTSLALEAVGGDELLIHSNGEYTFIADELVSVDDDLVKIIESNRSEVVIKEFAPNDFVTLFDDEAEYTFFVEPDKIGYQ